MLDRDYIIEVLKMSPLELITEIEILHTEIDKRDDMIDKLQGYARDKKTFDDVFIYKAKPCQQKQ